MSEILRELHAFVPRGVCESDYPDDCPVCRARELLTGVSQEQRHAEIRRWTGLWCTGRTA